jgi:hypothetical protein
MSDGYVGVVDFRRVDAEVNCAGTSLASYCPSDNLHYAVQRHFENSGLWPKIAL